MTFGRRVIDASKTNIKRQQLELGGKSPDIVFADADLERAVPGAAMGIFNNTGQICFAGSCIIVERRIAVELTERLAAHARTLKVGPSMHTETQISSAISEKQREGVMPS